MKTFSFPLKTSLAALAIACAGAFPLQAAAHPGDGAWRGGGPMMMHDRGGPMMGPGAGFFGARIERMLDGINASADQKARVKQILEAAATDVRSQREAARGLHDQAMQIFTQPNVDARAAETLRQQMLAQHDQASKRMMQAMLDVSAVLTPEQRKQIGERMAQRREMMERHRRDRETFERPRS